MHLYVYLYLYLSMLCVNFLSPIAYSWHKRYQGGKLNEDQRWCKAWSSLPLVRDVTIAYQ